jgi:hypothetical protein
LQVANARGGGNEQHDDGGPAKGDDHPRQRSGSVMDVVACP